MDQVISFISTYEEYLRITSIPEVSINDNEMDDRMYTSIQLRLMLLRKYIQRKEDVHIRKVIESLKLKTNENDVLRELLELYKKTMEKYVYKASNGDQFSIIEMIELYNYGILLHSDNNKRKSLGTINEESHLTICLKIIKVIENLLNRIYSIALTIEEKPEDQEEEERAEVIIYDYKNQKQQIKRSYYWSNMPGVDLEEEIEEWRSSLTSQEKVIIDITNIYIDLLQKSSAIEDVKLLRPQEPELTEEIYEKEQNYFKDDPNIGISYTIRYSDRHCNKAYVYVLKNTSSRLCLVK